MSDSSLGDIVKVKKAQKHNHLSILILITILKDSKNILNENTNLMFPVFRIVTLENWNIHQIEITPFCSLGCFGGEGPFH